MTDLSSEGPSTPAGGEVVYSDSMWQQPFPEVCSPQRREVIDQVAARILGLGTHRLRVGIDGRTAAGKTTLGHEVAEQVAAAGRPVLRACLDDFKRPWRERHLYDRASGEGYYRNAFDYDAVTSLLLEPCAPDGSGVASLCSIDPLTQQDHSDTRVRVPEDAVLIVDGVFAFRSEIDAHWDLRIWVDIAPEQSIARGTGRDQDWAGSEAEAIHRDRYGVAEEVYLAEAAPIDRVDLAIDNSRFDEPRFLRS